MRIMRSRQPALPAPPHPLMRVAAATSASPRRPGCTRLYFPHLPLELVHGVHDHAAALLLEAKAVVVARWLHPLPSPVWCGRLDLLRFWVDDCAVSDARVRHRAIQLLLLLRWRRGLLLLLPVMLVLLLLPVMLVLLMLLPLLRW